jgi:hypothetical protein
MGVVSMVYAQSECAAKEVYLFRGLAPRREVVPAGADGKATVEQDVDESESTPAAAAAQRPNTSLHCSAPAASSLNTAHE